MPVALWLLLMFIGSTELLSAEHTSRFLTPFLRWLYPDISQRAIATVHFVVRKAAHVTEYAILTSVLWRALRISLAGKSRALIAAIACVGPALFAASDEFHQSFMPSRTASPNDVLVDCVGVLLAAALCWTVTRPGAPDPNR